jgi:hypothetical protein
MEGKYVFWYCGTHDDGCIIHYSVDEINNMSEEQILNQPEYLNLCYASPQPNTSETHVYCIYHMKGDLNTKMVKQR